MAKIVIKTIRSKIFLIRGIYMLKNYTKNTTKNTEKFCRVKEFFL